MEKKSASIASRANIPPMLSSGGFCEHLTISQVIDDRVQSFAECPAIVYKNKSTSYKELDMLSGEFFLAIKNHRIKEGCRIAIWMHRSDKMIAALLAVLKAGCSYVPIDPDTPQERIDFILRDSETRLLLHGRGVDASMCRLDIPKISEEQISMSGSVVGSGIQNSTSNSKDVAYVIYTSGSTGTPKGVQVTHRNLHNYSYWFREEFSMTSDESIDFSTTLSFDFSVTSTVVPLMCGATIKICAEDVKSFPHQYLDFLEQELPSFIKLTPSYFAQLVKLPQSQTLASTTMTIILGGEALVPSDINKWLSLYPNHKVVNEYGPTEATVATLSYTIESGDPYLEQASIPIGTPAFNTEVYVLNGLKLASFGETGELCIAGKSVSLGYIGNEELNKTAFIDNPFEENGKLYRTGDLVEQREDGNFEFLGRLDTQIKIRGYRVEPEEIQFALLKHKTIEQATVQANLDSDQVKLCAYIKFAANSACSAFELRQYLSKLVPPYMVPSYFVFLDEMPLTINGKLDREALPSPSESAELTKSTPPQTETEKLLLAVWKTVLSNCFVGVTDEFFVVGGDSLNAAQIIHQIEKVFSVSLSLSDFYEQANVRKLSMYIDEKLIATLENDKYLLEQLLEIEKMSDSEIKGR